MAGGVETSAPGVVASIQEEGESGGRGRFWDCRSRPFDSAGLRPRAKPVRVRPAALRATGSTSQIHNETSSRSPRRMTDSAAVVHPVLVAGPVFKTGEG